MPYWLIKSDPGAFSIGDLKKVASEPCPDPTEGGEKAKCYDPKSSEDNPRWVVVGYANESEFKNIVSLVKLEGMLAIARGVRLSNISVEAKRFRDICKKGL